MAKRFFLERTNRRSGMRGVQGGTESRVVRGEKDGEAGGEEWRN
jgi:hypothetical protein